MSQVLIKIIGDYDVSRATQRDYERQQIAHHDYASQIQAAAIEHLPEPAPPSFARSLAIYCVRTAILLGLLLTAGWQSLVMMRQLILGV